MAGPLCAERLTSMFTPAILHKGDYELSDIAVSVSQGAWTPSASYDVLARDAWQERVREAEGEAQPIWDGQFYRLTNIGDVRGGSPPPEHESIWGSPRPLGRRMQRVEKRANRDFLVAIIANRA